MINKRHTQIRSGEENYIKTNSETIYHGNKNNNTMLKENEIKGTAIATTKLRR